MTTGSWSTKKTTTGLSTDCHSSNSSVTNGSVVSWIGTDSVVRRRPRVLTAKEREARFLLPSVPWKTHKELLADRFKVDHSRTANVTSSSEMNIFDATREKRFNIPLSSEPTGDYGVPHPYKKNWESWSQSIFRWMSNASGIVYSGTVSNCGFTFVEAPALWGSAQEYKLLERLREKVTGTDFNAASFIGAEGRDTIRFMTNTTQRVYRALMALRRGRFDAAVDVLRAWRRVPQNMPREARRRQLDVYRDLVDAVTLDQRRGAKKTPWSVITASQWLEIQLAIAPLLGDVQACAEMLAHLTSQPMGQTYRASVRTVSRRGRWSYETLYGVNEREQRVSLVAYLRRTPSVVQFSGVLDPEVTIWNAIPLSFVSDWFLPIGDFLEARANAGALAGGTYVRSTKVEVKVQNPLIRFGIYPQVNSTIVSNGPEQRYKRGYLERTILSSLDVPTPEFKPLASFLSWRRLATATSLVTAISHRQNRYWQD